MSGLIRSGERSGTAAGKSGEGLQASAPPKPSMLRRVTAGESAAQKARKKSIVEEQEEEDDRQIRFTIGGVGQRMTKEDFIREMQKLDKGTRREVVDQSNAPNTVKKLAKQDPQPEEQRPPGPQDQASSSNEASLRAQDATFAPTAEPQGEASKGGAGSTRRSPASSRSVSPSSKAVALDAPSRDAPETAVERRRRLAVLQGVGDTEEDLGETAAERRRREAALGMASSGVGEDDDSDDDDTPRVPPPRRGIRFADALERGKDTN